MENRDDAYQPISCELHSQYELAIMHSNKLALSWLENDKLVKQSNIQPLDVLTKDKAEFLVAVNAQNEKLWLRLDQITKMRILE